MALNPEPIPLNCGPSLRDIELSLTDGAMGPRLVRFQFADPVKATRTSEQHLVVQVVGLTRLDSYHHWSITGVAETTDGRRKVVIEYDTKSRFGAVTIGGV